MTDKKKNTMAGLLGMAGLMAGASDLLGHVPRSWEKRTRPTVRRSPKQKRKRRQAKRDRKINRQRRK